MALVDRLRAAREVWVTAGGISVLIRRPTQYQLVRVRAEEDVPTATLRLAIVDWKASAADLGIPDGDSAPIPFDVDAFLEWIGDHTDAMLELLERVGKELEKATGIKASVEKNS